jgi:hypothetical protein
LPPTACCPGRAAIVPTSERGAAVAARRERIDAVAVAENEPGTAIGATRAGAADLADAADVRAGVASASAAIFAIDLDVHARVPAALRSADAGEPALAGRADLTGRANRPASATILRIDRGVDATISTLGRAPAAHGGAGVGHDAWNVYVLTCVTGVRELRRFEIWQ